jgi:hypothetical protein
LKQRPSNRTVRRSASRLDNLVDFFRHCENYRGPIAQHADNAT